MNQDSRLNHYDVGIYGLWYGINYGSQITYFALNYVVKSLGCSAAMIQNPLSAENEEDGAWDPYAFAKRCGFSLLPFADIDSMAELNQYCDKFLIGSDQMWNYYLSRPYQYTYFLDFVDREKVKITYATSFGKAEYTAPQPYRNTAGKYLEKITYLSVRDSFSRDILRNEFKILAKQLIDPVFLCPREEYEKLAVLPDVKDYIFVYVLDPNPIFGQAMKEICETTKKKMLVAFDMGKKPAEQIGILNLSHPDISFCMEPVSTEEWLGFFEGADFVLTDSFHGTCFSIIFQKPFIVKKNNMRGGLRIEELVRLLGIQGHMAITSKGIMPRIKKYGIAQSIDYAAVGEKLQKPCQEGFDWLQKALEAKKVHTETAAAKLEAQMCTGCSACENICPAQAIKVIPDALGYYKRRVDERLCIGCGKCVQACPAISLPDKRNDSNPDVFEFKAADAAVVENSSSGGFFPTLASLILNKGGVVFGAAWAESPFSDDEQPIVRHVEASSMEELGKLQKSKYLQSYGGNSFRRVKEYLDHGKYVLYSGTPCQIAGLRKFLKKNYEKLLLVDVLCGNAPSPLFFRKYLEEDFPDGIEAYEFRTKLPGKRSDAMRISVLRSDGTRIYRYGKKQDNYQRAYHSHLMCPVHCEKCIYQRAPRFGDLTMGDFWGIRQFDPECDDSRGMSVVLYSNEKGRIFLNSIPKEKIAVLKQVPYQWLGGNGFAFGNNNWKAPGRDLFYEAILKGTFSQAIDYALKPNHGEYRSIYSGDPSVLQYDSYMLHFQFETDIWEEHSVDGKPLLLMKKQNVDAGHHATLPLTQKLASGGRYLLKARFRVKTTSELLNLHIKDSGSREVQVIHSQKLDKINDGMHWIEVSAEFSPDAGYYDQFSIGALQVQGDQNFIIFDYIRILRAAEASS